MGGLAWRLIVDDAAGSGLWNMAVDQAIHSARAEGSVPPTLRIYTWARPTVTLGRFQDATGVDLAFCAQHGVDVVRRSTGGRGVLHDDEVTYSVAASADDGIPRGVAASYRYLCAGLADAYRILGVDAELTQRSRGNADSAACYLHATPADLSVGARKLSGSAQVWADATVLQHGSFIITRDVELESAIFRMDGPARRSMADTTATLADGIAGVPTRAEIVRAIAAGFEQGLGLSLIRAQLTASEKLRAEELAEDAERRGIRRVGV